MPVFATHLEVKSRLAELGLSADIFMSAAQRGFAERAAASPYDPTTAPGTDAWRYTVRDVRQKLDMPGDDWRIAVPLPDDTDTMRGADDHGPEISPIIKTKI